MPYTPPSHRSPASSASASPDASRRSSIQAIGANPRPQLPRSASYLTRHRRTPSAVGSGSDHVEQLTPQDTVDDLKAMVMSSSIRQSPPPVTGDRAMPKGVIISPPESSSSSDEDDLPEMRGRTLQNLKELQHAISQIPQHRESSPSKAGVAAASDAGGLMLRSSQSEVVSEEDSEDDALRKPQMVRKKSGELVRPALRPASRRRPSSMPGTPTFSKAVHFDSHLEHVRHFLQVDRPLAVSAGSSPVDNYDSENEYPFHADNKSSKTPPFEWEIIMTNFPVDTPVRRSQPVRLERVWLSNDQKCLIGSVVVANYSYQKYVTCRFTLDYWKTTSEVTAEYISEVRPNESPVGHDRFNFTIKLSDLANLESKTLYFCIRYTVNGEEFWDNNCGTNFQADFRKKMLPQNGKKGVIGAANRSAGGLPRSSRRPTAASVARPKSMSSEDEFGNHGKVNLDQSLSDFLGESGSTGLRLKGVKSTSSLPSDNLSSRLGPPSGQAFANRYDFGASLSAAMQATMTGKADGLYMKPSRKPSGPALNTSVSSLQSRGESNQAATTANKSVPSAPGADSPNASIASSSYEELVNKYCFFGSKQSSPQLMDGTLRGGRFDGADDGSATRSTNSSTSTVSNSPRQNDGEHTNHAGAAMHHSLRAKDPNPYFQQVALSPVGASPSESPLRGLQVQQQPRTSSPSVQQQQPWTSAMASGPSMVASSPSTSVVGSLHPFAGTSPNEFPYHVHDRFPFSGTEAHAATTIRG